MACAYLCEGEGNNTVFCFFDAYIQMGIKQNELNICQQNTSRFEDHKCSYMFIL